MSTVTELIVDGLPPSDRVLRDLLLPVIDDIPADLQGSKHFDLVLRHIDEYLSVATPQKVVSTPVRTDDVDKVTQVVAGRSIVLIGGGARPGASQALAEAFKLKAVHWVSSREHQSIASFEYAVADEDVTIVLVAIRWSSHSFEGVKEMCAKHGKLYVRLPGGYNPNQVALQIMNQVGNRLYASG
jgi:predicted DNA binding CopG/RHH family protein